MDWLTLSLWPQVADDLSSAWVQITAGLWVLLILLYVPMMRWLSS